MLDLQAGRIDGYISDIPALLYYTKDKPTLKVVERIPTGEKYSIMFAKDAPLASEVNTVLGDLKREGYLAALHETWFGAKADPSTTTVQACGHAARHLEGGRGFQAGRRPRSPWSVIDTFFNLRVLGETLPLVLSGLWVTVLLGAASIVLGNAGGLALAVRAGLRPTLAAAGRR